MTRTSRPLALSVASATPPPVDAEAGRPPEGSGDHAEPSHAQVPVSTAPASPSLIAWPPVSTRRRVAGSYASSAPVSGGGDTDGSRRAHPEPSQLQVSSKASCPSSPPKRITVSVVGSYAMAAPSRGDGVPGEDEMAAVATGDAGRPVAERKGWRIRPSPAAAAATTAASTRAAQRGPGRIRRWDGSPPRPRASLARTARRTFTPSTTCGPTPM
ncbi:MAG TPA: hypothetical protein DEG26_07925 [Chloroflexi bacterium]|nr:hypothetical protein [Chloroflexota bacterium]